MRKSLILWGILICILGCTTDEPYFEQDEEQAVQLSVQVMNFSNTPSIASEIKKISALIFNHDTRLFYKEIAFDVIDTSYKFKIPAGTWDLILLGTGDSLAPKFGTPLEPYITHIDSSMLALPSISDTIYGNTREYFYAHQVCTVSPETTEVPKMTLKRIVSRLNLNVSPELSGVLGRVQITLCNVVSSVDFLGNPSDTYVHESIHLTKENIPEGAYTFTFYSFGSKPLGSDSNTDFMVDMLYRMEASPTETLHFYMFSPSSFQADGMVVNTITKINLGL